MALRIEQIRPFPLEERDLSDSQVWEEELEFRTTERILVRASSGSGKTTFLSILYGMRKDYSGSVRWNGTKLSDLSERELCRLRRESWGMVFQDLELFEELSVRENLLIKNRLSDRFSEKELRDLLERLDIRDQWEKPVHRLSTGQKQRTAIARALSQPLELLLLDEPFSHLDDENVQRATALIEERLEEEGAGMILASLADPYGLRYDRTLRL